MVDSINMCCYSQVTSKQEGDKAVAGEIYTIILIDGLIVIAMVSFSVIFIEKKDVSIEEPSYINDLYIRLTSIDKEEENRLEFGDRYNDVVYAVTSNIRHIYTGLKFSDGWGFSVLRRVKNKEELIFEIDKELKYKREARIAAKNAHLNKTIITGMKLDDKWEIKNQYINQKEI